MRKTLLLQIFLYASLAAASQQSVRIIIRELPSYHDKTTDLYLAGSFNSWKPGDSAYRFERDKEGSYFFSLSLAAGKYEYKITRGDWTTTECRKGGGTSANRILVMPSDTVIVVSVEDWADHFTAVPHVSTASKNVHIIDTAFYMPQLKRSRRIWIYLPDGYASSRERYPVMYMHDGQNLFDNPNSFSGEWGIDEFLDSTKRRKYIIVAIDHGGMQRLNEYGPYHFSVDTGRYRGWSITPEGDRYTDFLVKTLKPWIDKRYRTLRDKKNTSIAGSSMGGLISLYALLRYPKVYGSAGIFSPAFWTAPPLVDEVKRKGKKVNSRIYFYAGKQEGQSMVPDMMKVFTVLSKVSKSTMEMVIRDEGKHTESRWRLEFPLFYDWLNP